MSAKLTVPGGTCVHSSFGEIGFGSACVNLFGMTPPSSKSGEVSVRPGPGGGPPAFGCAKAKPTPAIRNIAPTVSILMSVSPWKVSAYQEGCGTRTRRRKHGRVMIIVLAKSCEEIALRRGSNGTTSDEILPRQIA